MITATPSKSPSLKRDAIWTAADTLISSGLAFLFRLIVARFVAPSEFGVFALALTTFAIVQVINEFGMAATVIQRSDDRFDETVVDTAYAASTIVSTSLFILNLLIISPLSAWAFDSERVGLVTAVIGVSFLFTPTVSISRALLFRKRDYRAVTIARIASTILSLIIASIVLILYRNVWALVVQILLAQIFLAIGMHRLGDWRPKLKLSRAALREMIGYSGLVFGNDVFGSIAKNLDVIVLGRLVAQSQVGLYSLAFYITDVVRLNLASILNRVMFTHYSKIQNDLVLVRKYVVRSASWNLLAIFPVMILLMLAGPILLPYFLGHKWAAMTVPLQLLALSVMLATISGTSSTAFKAIGRPGAELGIAIFTGVVVLVPLLVAGVLVAGTTGAAAAVAIKSAISVFIRQPMLDRLIGHTAWPVAQAVLGGLLLQTPLTIVWLLTFRFLPLEPVYGAFVATVVASVVYVVTLVCARPVQSPLWPGFNR